MFTYALSTTSVVSSAVGTAPSYSYCNPIDLKRKWHDGKDLALKVDIYGSSASGELNVIPAIGAVSGGTYSHFVTASGSSVVILSGTSVGGENADGSFLVPLTISPIAGAYERLRGVPYIKFGFMAVKSSVTVAAYLLVG